MASPAPLGLNLANLSLKDGPSTSRSGQAAVKKASSSVNLKSGRVSPTKGPSAGVKGGRTSPVKGLGSTRLGRDVVSKDLLSTEWRESQTSPRKGGKKSSSKVGCPPCIQARSTLKAVLPLQQYGDRYIPRREDESNPPTLDLTSHSIASASDAQHTAELSSAMGIELNRRILAFASEPPPTSKDTSSALLAAYARNTKRGTAASNAPGLGAAGAHRRRIATMPEKVLDAPGLVDDYYLNLVDWSCGNLVAIALGGSVYIWNAETSEVSCLCSLSEDEESEDYICSVRFSGDGSYLALGTSNGPVQIYDLESGSLIRTMSGHQSRIPTLDWSGAILSSGARDGSIWNHDVRAREHKIGEMKGHRGEVCGLAWRPEPVDGVTAGTLGLLASGGNDNVVNVWDGRMLSAPKMTKTNHTAAVKALAWCPWQSTLLGTGGGSSDKVRPGAPSCGHLELTDQHRWFTFGTSAPGPGSTRFKPRPK